MAEFKMKLEVDTTDVERIAIGVRIYDMFKADNVNNKLHNDLGTYINERDINAMYQLVNNTDRCIQVYR